MTTITTTDLRENLAEVFKSVQEGEQIIVRFGRGKKAVLVSLNLVQTTSKSRKLPKNHSLLKFAKSEYYQKLPANTYFSTVKDLKKHHQENFLKDTFEDKYSS
ncbi:MAG: type II toxin-antitoxin system prevent-host-death family antitoxin [bacterium]